SHPTRTRTVVLQFDAMGRLIQRSEDTGGKRFWTAFTYNARGQMLTRLEPSGAIWSWQYDAAGFVVSTKAPMDQQGEVVTGFTTDAAGLVTAKSGPRPGERWAMTHDPPRGPKTRTLAASPGVLEAPRR